MGITQSFDPKTRNQVLNQLCVGKTTLQVVFGSLCQERTSCIINPTSPSLSMKNSPLLYNNGIKIQRECYKHLKTHGPLPITENLVTCGGRLQSANILHSAIPSYIDGSRNQSFQLKQTILKILHTADRQGLKSLSLPILGSGDFNFPNKKASETLVKTVRQYLQMTPRTEIVNIRFVTQNSPSLVYLNRRLEG